MSDRLLLADRATERAAIPVMHPGRVDVIAAGALILRRLVDLTGLDEVVVSASTTSSTGSPGRSPAEEPADRRTLERGAPMTLHDIPITMLDERESSLGEFQGRALLVVNVASKCGLTPQYAGLEQLAERYADRGLHRPRRALQPVRRAGAGHRRGDRGVLLGDVRRDASR